MDVTKIIAGKIDGLGQPKIPTRDGPEGKPQQQPGKEHEPHIPKQNMQDAVDALNAGARSLNNKVSFSYHEKTNRVIMKVLDPQTNETIREIPSRDMIKLLEHIRDFIGTFVDELR